MTSISPTSVPALPAAAPFDPFASLKREIKTIVTDSANTVFEQQQPMIRRTIGEAIGDQEGTLRTAIAGAIEEQMPTMRTELEGVITAQLPVLRAQLDDFVADTQPKLQTMVDETIERVKTELPGVIDAEVKRQRDAITAEVSPIVEQQAANVKSVANAAVKGGAIGGGIGALAGFGLGWKAWNGPTGGLLAAAGLAALGATAGLLVGGWRGAAGLETGAGD